MQNQRTQRGPHSNSNSNTSRRGGRNLGQHSGRRSGSQGMRTSQGGYQQERPDWNVQQRWGNWPNRNEADEGQENFGGGGNGGNRQWENLNNENDEQQGSQDYNASYRGFENEQPYGSQNFGGRDWHEQSGGWPRFGSQGGSSNEGFDDMGMGNTGGRYGLGYQEQGGFQSQGRGMGSSQQRSGLGPKGYKRSDERIKEDVSDRIFQMRGMDASDVEVQVNNGEVTLTGTITNRQMKWQLENLIDSVNGVSDIHNQLRVKREDSSGSGKSETTEDKTAKRSALTK